MRNLLLPLLVLWLCGCSPIPPAEARLLDACTVAIYEGRECKGITIAFSHDSGKVAQTQVSLLPPMGGLETVAGGVLGGLQ